VSEASAERRGGWRRWHNRLYEWVLHWAGHKHARAALFLMALAEASFFPIPPDVLLMAMCLAKPLRSFRYAAITTVGSLVGGLIGYAIGRGAWHALEPFAFGHLGAIGFTPENFATVQEAYQANAFLALFTAGFTPIPYKVFTIAAGVFSIPLPVFVLASLLGRAGRFGLVALLFRLFGPKIKPFIDRYLGWLTIAFVVLLILGFALLGRLG
jgi:membrane protein YqaA with SNARE-associated domain